DAVDATLRKDPALSCIEWRTREIIKDRFGPDEQEIGQAVKRVRGQLSWVKWFKDKAVEDWLDWDRLRAHQLWQECVLIRLMGMTGKRPDLEKALLALSQAL